MSEQRNLILAIVVSLAILFGFQFFAGQYQSPPPQQQTAQQRVPEGEMPGVAPSTGQAPAVPGAAAPADPSAARDAALESAPRIAIDSPSLDGSISLRGARIDDLTLNEYRVTVDPGSPPVTLLSPAGTPDAYYAQFGWSSPGGAVAAPDADTIWTADRTTLTPNDPVTLTWDNGQGLRFVRVIQLDRDYMFTITQRVENSTGEPVTLYPYALVSRSGTPETAGFFILHEGPLGAFQNKLVEIDYEDLQETGTAEYESEGGWIGITDKYWLTALVPDQKAPMTGTFRHSMAEATSKYQVDYLRAAQTIPAGGSVEIVDRMFAGAKEVQLLDSYEAEYGIQLFDRAVDFGWFYFLTKPLFYVIDYFYRILGNFGLAILALTVCVKLLFFPLANKSYKAMSKMKLLQPEMMKLRERFGDDRQKLNQEMMALYKRQKVNPVSGCLPILIQIPVFFALYKVLFVTIEMRHAPFYGWIQDLSAPDPLTVFNLFGAIPWDPPQFLMIGIWPLLMGVSMYLQQLLNPQPPDPVQAKVFLLMPVFFTFLLGSFPAGLVIYWTWNNVLSIAQQWVIMRRTGADPMAGVTKKPGSG